MLYRRFAPRLDKVKAKVGLAITGSQSARSVQTYFDCAADTYDQVFTNTAIGRAERDAVQQDLRRVFHSGQRILELNCGTGLDALSLARCGVKVLACDIAPRMIEIARRRLSLTSLGDLVSFRVLANEQIEQLVNEGPFDGAFSNFEGLNCVEDLASFARKLRLLLKPGSRILLCMLGRFVPLEIAWHLAHGHPRKSMRRFRREGTIARLTDDVTFRVHYPSVKALARMFAPAFRLREWKGIGVVLPPAYFEAWARRFPRILDGLATADRWLGRLPLLRSTAGHVLLQFERLED